MDKFIKETLFALIVGSLGALILTALNIQWWQIVIFFLLILVSPILLIQLSIWSEDNKHQKERDNNYKETGYSETDYERRDRERSEKSERISQNERDNNYKETGYSETDYERRDRERRVENEKKIQLEKSRLENKDYELKNKLGEELKNKLDAEEKIKLNRPNEVSDSLKRKEGTDCYVCKTKVDKDGYCYC